ncbi:hypothetical protein K7A41_01615 [Sphingobacterium sp. InxBP1]|nr:hypothetical protein [Sphingobacterium sp. InxBP1]
MKWIILLLMVGSTYSDARPKYKVVNVAQPLEDLVPKLENLADKLTDLSKKMK